MSICKAVVLSWIAGTAALGGSVLFAPSAGPSVSSAEVSTAPRPDRDAFFERLLVGGAANGKVYVEVPLKAAAFANATSAENRRAVWDAFFGRVLREKPPEFGSGPLPYWGEFAYRKVDWTSLAAAVDIKVGDVLRVRTTSADASVKVLRYAVHHEWHGNSNLLLAVAQPLSGFKVASADFLVAAPRLPPCGSGCMPRARTPDAGTLEKIRTFVSIGAKIPPGQQIKEIRALEGHFTRAARQYVVYVDFGAGPDISLVRYWRTVVLDADLSLIALIGENEYSHIEPRFVSDVDGDALDEVWVGLSGYEGRNAGLLYWRGGGGNGSFRIIQNAYHGL